jgi:hypothetical protein
MDQLLLILLIAAVAFAAGYAVRANISQRRRERAKRSRKFFNDASLSSG